MKRLALALALLAAARPVAAGEPHMFRPELQNERVRVLRVRLAPHQRIPMHLVPPHVVVWLTDARLTITYPGGRTETKQFRAGEVQWVTLGEHAGENAGDRPIEFIAIEPRPRGPAGR